MVIREWSSDVCSSYLVVGAPPGAGKATRVAPARLDQPWCKGKVWLLSPRRLAARAAAERIAEEMGEAVGGRVGYANRLDSKQAAATRLLVLTPGLFRNRLLADPAPPGVSAVLFTVGNGRAAGRARGRQAG